MHYNLKPKNFQVKLGGEAVWVWTCLELVILIISLAGLICTLPSACWKQMAIWTKKTWAAEITSTTSWKTLQQGGDLLVFNWQAIQSDTMLTLSSCTQFQSIPSFLLWEKSMGAYFEFSATVMNLNCYLLILFIHISIGYFYWDFNTSARV